MKVGSLFSGIGGLDLGLERAGMEVIWQVENDPYCNKVLARHWPHVRRYGDIEAVDFGRVERPDLICGGFPCQPVSCAGKRQGDKDKRWLWPEFYRAVCEARPRWVLVENVPGLLSADSGRLFGGILGDLASRGYDAEWDLLPAAAFGAPHLRYRLFIVAWHVADFEKWKCGFWYAEDDGQKHKESNAFTNGCADVADLNQIRLQGGTWLFGPKRGGEFEDCDLWKVEPDVGRVVHGVPCRVDRIRCLGNAVVPQVAEWVGRRIMAGEDDRFTEN